MVTVDPRVPPLRAWPAEGIVGTIGSGPSKGALVAAEPLVDGAGAWAGYELHLPVDRLLDVRGGLVMDDWAADDRRPGAEGGLIDSLTRDVDVTWTVDPDAVRSFWARRDP